MNDEPPALIAIDHDDYHAQFVGRTTDGRQFFLTTPFEPARDAHPGAEYVALYLFNAAGDLLEAKINAFGPRAGMDKVARDGMCEQRLIELGEVSFGRISIAPFSVQRFGIEFGLIPRPPEEDDDEWAVELQPGNAMAFFAPWDSGEYDT